MKQYNNASNLHTIKANNRSLILRILNSLGPTSRAELARISGLTKTSLTNITAELMASGLLYETGTYNSASGRKPILLNLLEDARYAVGLYISRDFVYTNLVNLKGRILKECKEAHPLSENEHSFLESVFQGVQAVLPGTPEEMERVLGIGVASIGPIDIKRGIILDPPNFKGLKSIPIVDLLRARYPLPVFIDNDMNASAIAEKLFGNAKKLTDFIYVGVTNGIGSGVILHGDIFGGSHGFAGEIGHTTIDIHGEKCDCGNAGCLELYASIPAVVNRVRASIELGAESVLTGAATVTWPDIVKAAAGGDAFSLEAINRLVFYLSAGLVNAVNTFDPEVVFIGHDIALAGELVIAPLREAINGAILFKNAKKVGVQLSLFKDYSPCIGAPSLVLDRFFRDF